MGNYSTTQDTIKNDSDILRADENAGIWHFYNNILTDNTKRITMETFSKYFNSLEIPEYSKLFYDYIVNDGEITFERFRDCIGRACRTSSTNSLELFWLIFGKKDYYNTNLNQLNLILIFVLELCRCDRNAITHLSNNLSNHFFNFWKKKQNKESEIVNIGDINIEFKIVNEWVNEYFPYIPKVLISYLSSICFPVTEVKEESSSTSLANIFSPPILQEGSQIISNNDAIQLGLFSDCLQGRWNRLYSTALDGLSFNRLAHHILGYEGPSCLIIQCRDIHHTILGVYTQERWRDSNRFYGSSLSFLFTLHPNLHIYRSKSNSNGAYQWLNLKSYGLPHGLGIGGSTEKFRLFIPDSLETCIANSNCYTFESGSLLTDLITTEFQIDAMEVWACGGEDSIRNGMRAQQKDRENRDKLIQQARKCDKSAFASNSFDQEYLLPKNFSHKVRVDEDASR